MTWRTTQTKLTIMLLGLVTLTGLPASAGDLSEYKEVSYLVFHRKAGFDKPEFETSLLDGTVTIRFRRLPRGWPAILAPQMATSRKQRFFRNLEPVVEAGTSVGIRVRVGTGPFETHIYRKERPRRWVLRVGELRRPPVDRGPSGVPVIPYSDLVEEEAEGRSKFVRAELAFARGGFDKPCLAFHELREQSAELSSWAGLREADCLLEVGEHAAALEILDAITRAGHTPAAIALARVRMAEASGAVLDERFDRSVYNGIDPNIQTYMGTVADEVSYREARTLLFRGDAGEAFRTLERLHARRPESPFFLERKMLNTLRWRAVRDSAQDGRWLLTAKNYLHIPPTRPEQTPNWTRIHEYGAHALREIGLPKRAVQVYLHLLRTPEATIDETKTIIDLAETYNEAGDAYRSKITVRYLTEREPGLGHDRRVVRLRGSLALGAGHDPAMGQQARDLAGLVDKGNAGSGPDGDGDTRLVVQGAVRALQVEGIVAARDALAGLRGNWAAGGLAAQVARDLAFAAGDCQALSRMATPLELADGETLLFSGACLMQQGRVTEATVMLEAARIYAAAEMGSPELDPILNLIAESAEWWTKNAGRLAKADGSTKSIN